MITGNEVERFIDIQGYGGLYKISNYGNVHNGIKIMAKSVNVDGYFVIGLTKNGKQKQFRISRLVAIHFVDNPKNLPEVNHLDYDKSNNFYLNLEWCDCFRQQQHSALKLGRKWNTKTFTGKVGKLNHKSKPVIQLMNGIAVKEFESTNLAAKELGLLQCKISACCLGHRKSHGGFQFIFK